MTFNPHGRFFPGRYTGSPATQTAGAEQVAGGAHIPAGPVQIGARLYPADGREIKVRDNRKGEAIMSALEEMLREMGGISSSCKRGFSEDVEVIKKYLDAPKLVGLEHGDVLETIEGHEGRPSYGLTVKKFVFDRYLTQTERELFMAKVEDGGARDADICVASSVGGSIPLFHFVDSRAFRKVSQE